MPGDGASHDSADLPAPPRSPKSIAVGWLIALTAILAIVLLVRWTAVVESAAFFAPSTAAYRTPAGIQEFAIDGPGRGEIHAWKLGVPDSTPKLGTILFCHGNAGNLPDHLAFVDRLPGMGFEVVMFDYRGFGRSTGRTRVHRGTLIADTRHIADVICAMHPDEPLFLLGHSMGGVMAMNLASERPDRFAGVAAVAAFASFPRVAADFAGPLGWTLIASGLSAQQAVNDLEQTPLMLLHGSADTIVHSYHSERIAAEARAAGVAAELRLVEGADHVDIFDPPYDAQRLIAEFFRAQLD